MTLASHLEAFKENIGEEKFSEIESLTADAGYGSEENYELLEQNTIEGFVKYNTFDKEQEQLYQRAFVLQSGAGFLCLSDGTKNGKKYESTAKRKMVLYRNNRMVDSNC